jgi:uncharacterized membrane protein
MQGFSAHFLQRVDFHGLSYHFLTLTLILLLLVLLLLLLLVLLLVQGRAALAGSGAAPCAGLLAQPSG